MFNIFKSKTQAPQTANDAFVTLLQVAEDDVEIRKQLVWMLSQNNINRKSLINSFIANIEGDPNASDFSQALRLLLDDEIAQKAHSLLKE